MTPADTPMPGEASGNRPERDPATEMEVEENPQPEPDSSLPPVEEDSEVQDEPRPPT